MPHKTHECVFCFFLCVFKGGLDLLPFQADKEAIMHNDR